MSELVLTAYTIDIVEAQDDLVWYEEHKQYVHEPKVRMVTYKVLGMNPQHAMHRFFNEEAGEIIHTGEVVDRIMVGIDYAQPVIDG